MPVISVIVPIYNSGKYLCDCLKSICAQTFSDIEIILVDDGSTDSSGDICDAFREIDSRIKVIHKNNGGLASARNAGIDIAAGEYLMFCDSDDAVSSDWCNNLLHYANKYPDRLPFCAHSSSPDNFGTAADTPLKAKELFEFEDVFLLSEIGIGFAWNKIFKSSIISENNIRFRTWKEKSDFNEDLVFFMSYIKYCAGFVYTNTIDYCYYIRSNSLSRGNQQPLAERYIEKYSLWKDYINKYCPKNIKALNDVANDALYYILIFFIQETKTSLLPTAKFKQMVESKILCDIVNDIVSPKESDKIISFIKSKKTTSLWYLLKLSNNKGM